mgnify:CR=1 FL=1
MYIKFFLSVIIPFDIDETVQIILVMRYIRTVRTMHAHALTLGDITDDSSPGTGEQQALLVRYLHHIRQRDRRLHLRHSGLRIRPKRRAVVRIVGDQRTSLFCDPDSSSVVPLDGSCVRDRDPK